MKKQSNIFFTKFSEVVLADLTKEVKETIAFDLVESRRKTFTSADLWNIHRQARSRSQRKYL